MAYDTDELYNRALGLCNSHNLFYAQDIIDMLAISESTFYKHFPPDSKELKTLKEKIRENKAKVRVTTRKRLLEHNTASALIALMKIVGTDQEKKALTQSRFDSTQEGAVRDFVEAISNINSDRKEYKEPE